MFRQFVLIFTLMAALLALPGFSLVKSAGAQQTSSQCSMFYTVQRGDTLYRIARNYNATVSNLQTWNRLTNANRIQAGQSLCVGLQVIVDDSAPRTHTVQRGETLSSIARRYGISMSVLAQVNGITNPNRIYVGQVLSIPDVTIQTGS